MVISAESTKEAEALEAVRCGKPIRFVDNKASLHFVFPSESEKLVRILYRLANSKAGTILKNTGMFPPQDEQVMWFSVEM